MTVKPESRRNRLIWLCIACLAAWLGCIPGAYAMDEAARRAELERIRRELAETQDRIVEAYIAEQAPGKQRADILLVIGALYEMGRMGDGNPNPLRAAQYYKEAAEMGSPDGMCALGHVYDVGVKGETGEIPRDPARARALYEQAAEAGSVRAMVELGIMYADGRDIDPDSKKALEYFLEAGKWGEPAALDRLKPIMLKAREWEDAKPERKGKAGFPTSQDELIDKAKVDRYIDVTFNQQKLASAVYVELGRRLMAATKKR